MWYGSPAVLSLLRQGCREAREKNVVVENKEALVFNTSAKQRVFAKSCRSCKQRRIKEKYTLYNVKLSNVQETKI